MTFVLEKYGGELWKWTKQQYTYNSKQFVEGYNNLFLTSQKRYSCWAEWPMSNLNAAFMNLQVKSISQSQNQC